MFAESIYSIFADIAANPEELEEEITIIEATPINEVSEVVETITNEPVQNEEILLTESNLVGRKVFGQWGIGAGFNYGIITGENIHNEIIVNWEDWEGTGDGKHYIYSLKDLVYVHENTNLNAIGIYVFDNETTEETPENEIIETVQETEYTNENKIKLQSIEFIWSESSEIQSNTIVNTFKEAEQLIKNAAFKAPDDGCYDKTKFLITWTDGNTYEGRIDIVKADSFKSAPLKDHILSFINYVTSDNESGWYAEEEKEAYKELLNKYTLEDEKHHTEQNKQSGKVLDFSSRFKAKQEQKETIEMKNHFLNNVMPYMDKEEIDQLQSAYKSNDENKLNEIWQRLMLTTAVKRATNEILKEN
jgi:hypothetical protein